MKYMIVKARSQEGLVESVSKLLDQNWIPQGGVAFEYDGPYQVWAQAMLRIAPVDV